MLTEFLSNQNGLPIFQWLNECRQVLDCTAHFTVQSSLQLLKPFGYDKNELTPGGIAVTINAVRLSGTQF